MSCYMLYMVLMGFLVFTEAKLDFVENDLDFDQTLGVT